MNKINPQNNSDLVLKIKNKGRNQRETIVFNSIESDPNTAYLRNTTY